MDGEEKMKKLLQTIHKSVTPSPGFRERLLRQLTLEVSRRAEPVRPRLWLKPVFWAPAAALVALAVIGYFVLLPLLSTPVSPPITAPSVSPPAPSPAPPVTSPPTELPSLPTPSPTPTPEPGPGPAPTPVSIPPAESVNFRLLISDEVNAIDHFASLNVTISSIGIHEAGDSGTWQTFELDTPADVDLKPLKGENALEVWSSQLTEGEYTKVFIYVDNVTGTLEAGVEADVKLPSNKLQISKPFTIGESVVNFVYDITVVEAGESGKYILKPQIDQSGPDKTFKLVTSEGKPDGAGKPEKTDTAEDELELHLEGDAVPGGTVILVVTDDGAPVPEATITVTLNGETLLEAQTNTDGRLEIELPEATGQIKIEAAFGEKDGELEIELEEPGNLKITTTRLPHGQIDVDYTATLEATGGYGPYTWSISEGDLPDGLALDSATGVIAGTPTTSGKYDFTVQIEDDSDPGQSETQKLSIQIKD